MKIDIHTHTRKIKSGDAATRNIETTQFIDIIKNTDVKILAITNHNHFDLKQYEEFRDSSTTCQIWPGIELDVLENGKRSHLIVICNPTNYNKFNEVVNDILKTKSADTFTISIAEVVEKFDHLDCIYIAHYLVKKPNLGDAEINLLAGLIKKPKRILKEATNAISAGIYISHGHNSIYGSDVQDWTTYVEDSKNLPELRLAVESFEQFCLLLERDEATINTILDKKVKENIQIPLFTVADAIELDIYNDINILFGSKGTGKTKILDSLSKYFNSRGHKTSVYKSNDKHLNDVYDIKGASFNCNVSEFGIDDCETEILSLKEVTDVDVTSLNKYLMHYSVQETNRISQKLKIKSIRLEDSAQSKRELNEVGSILKQFAFFREQVNNLAVLKNYIDESLIEELENIFNKVILQLSTKTEIAFFENKSIELLNGIISTFITEIAKKTGQPPKPIATGFAEFSKKRISIELAAKKIIACISQPISPIEEYVGSLGIKGELFCKTNLSFHNGIANDGSFTPVKNVKKTPQKNFVIAIETILRYVNSTELFTKIADLNDIDSVETITSTNELLLKYRHFTIDDAIYSPSNGESSMILLHQELTEDKEIYLIDEPERSLGNDYINDVIVPLLKEKALLGKKVIIATHDANIAVRTLPYNSIYRLHDQNRYFTFKGNPFSNSLQCIYGSRASLDWKEISMKTLEGGRDAFGERGKIYGN